MKLLVSELGAWSGYVSREFFHTMTALIVDHGWQHIEANLLRGQAGKVEAILQERFGELPSVILFWEGYHVFPTICVDLLHMNCRKCVFVDDLHSFNESARAFKELTLSFCDTIFSTYEYALDEYFPRLRRLPKQIVWSPHAASPDFLLPHNEHPENQVLLSGNINDRYPVRMRVKSLYDSCRYPIAYHPHPGYGCNHSGGASFGAAINRYRAAFTDCSAYKYLLAKYLEIPATGALLLACTEVRDQLRNLGFEENVHYLGVSGADLEEKIRYSVDPANREHVDAIRKRGQALVWERHTIAHRAQMIDQECA